MNPRDIELSRLFRFSLSGFSTMDLNNEIEQVAIKLGMTQAAVKSDLKQQTNDWNQSLAMSSRR
jgi:hypothetical protein